MLARERDNGAIRDLAFFELVDDGVKILDGTRDATGNDHCASLAANLLEANDLFVEVVHHDLSLELDRVLVSLNVATQFLPRALAVEFGIGFHGLDELVVAVNRRIAPEHIEDEAFIDR